MTDATERHIVLKLTSTAVLSASLTATTLVWFYESYRVPLKILETTIEFKDVEQKNKELEAAIEKEKSTHLKAKQELNTTQLELGTLNERILTQNLAINELHQSNLFHSDSLYPSGFGNPKIGDNVNILRGIYKAESIKWEDSEDGESKATLSLPDGYFKKVEYNFNQSTGKIIAIIFETDFPSEKLLLRRLSEIGGPPTHSKKYDLYRWPISKLVNGFLVSDRIYIIMDSDLAPALWREPKAE